MFARAVGVFAKPPRQSIEDPPGRTPAVSMDPWLAFRPYKAALEAGCTTEPSVSVPIETGAKPAATPTVEPDDEPAGVFRISCLRLPFQSNGYAHFMT